MHKSSICIVLLACHAIFGDAQTSLDDTSTSSSTLANQIGSCGEDSTLVSFEIVTGYVYTAPADMLDSQPGTLMLTDCINTCRKNSTCLSVNYETGLCVLFSSNADTLPEAGQLTTSQFPVFTIYAQKNCLRNAPTCQAAWSFERVMDYQLTLPVSSRRKTKTQQVEDRQECMDICLGESEFECRSAMFDRRSGECGLLDMDRHTLAGQPVFERSESIDYLEINCVDEPRRLCIYDTVKGKILKTVDSVYQAIATKDDCEDLCNNAPYRCHAYDFNDTGDNVCRLSHHSAQTLTHIEEPYLAILEATTYELSACYNVSVQCHSGDMTTRIETTTLFAGKMYAKGSPVSCMVDISDEMSFDIKMKYNDIECGVEKVGPGSYTNNLVLQHHDRIVTSADLGLSVSCQYDLANKSVSNEVDLGITGAIAPSLFEEAIVDSPNVVMKVVDLSGTDRKTAVVGDPLNLIFEIVDLDSPYEISVRDLVAVDEATNNELQLIDARGCPVDTSIMSEFRQYESRNKTLISSFDAFRFPSSRVVQFRAMVTPCLPVCAPVVCDVIDYAGQSRSVESFGKRRRRSARSNPTHQHPDEMLLMKSLQIVDRYGRRHQNEPTSAPSSSTPPRNLIGDYHSESNEAEKIRLYYRGHQATSNGCVNQSSLIMGAVIFLILQVIILCFWCFFWQRRKDSTRHLQKEAGMFVHGSPSPSDNLSYMYDNGFTRRIQ